MKALAISSDCLETFLFPAGWEGEDRETWRSGDHGTTGVSQSPQVPKSQSPSVMRSIKEAGQEYCESRVALIVGFGLGLTI